MLKFHQVQPGDTLSDIAVKYKADWRELSKHNKLSDPDKLQPGDVIMVPEQKKNDPIVPEPETSGTAGTTAPRGPQPYVAPEPYETSWPQYARGSDGKVEHTSSVAKSPPTVPEPNPGFLEGPGWSKPYPVHGNPKAERGANVGEMGSVETSIRPKLEAITDPSFWKEFLSEALPTALMAVRAPGARMGPHMPSPKTPPSTPAQSKWLQKEKDFFDKNPGALDTVDPNYAAAREAGMRPPTGPGGGQLTAEGKAADVKDWNFYRNQGRDSKATPFPRKEPPVRETYGSETSGTSAAADYRPGLKDFATRIANEIAHKYFGVPQGGGGRPVYDKQVTEFGTRARPLQDELGRTRDAAGETPTGPFSDFAKGTTVTKSPGPGSSVEKNVSPFRAAIQSGMDRPRQDGTEYAGPGVPQEPVAPTQIEPEPPLSGFYPNIQPGPEFGNPYLFGPEQLRGPSQVQKAGQVLNFPGDKSRATEGARPLTPGGGRSTVTKFERPQTEQQKYDFARDKQIAKERGMDPPSKYYDHPDGKSYPVKSERDFLKSVDEAMGVYEGKGFGFGRGAMKEEAKIFHADPKTWNKDYHDALRDKNLSPELRKALIFTRQILDENFFF